MSALHFKSMDKAAFTDFWPTFQAIVDAAETYAIEPGLSFDKAYQLWCLSPLYTFAVTDDQDRLLGAYYLKANAAGPGDHVCNCGYMVSPMARGKGVARAMCEHSQTVASQAGFQAMQFNAVVSTNEVAVALWQRLGFTIVGRVPKAYRHATLGLVDTYVMHKFL